MTRHWLVRYLVKRATWVVLTAVVAALFAVANVRAAHDETLSVPGTSTASPLGGGNINRFSSLFDPEGTVTVRVTTTITTSYLGVICSDGTYQAFGSTAVGTYTSVDLSGETGCFIYGTNDGATFNGGATGAGDFDYQHAEATPTPTATPEPTATPSPDPICDPYCIVALSEDDRERLDAVLAQGEDSSSNVAYGFGVLVFLVTVVLVVTGLRR